MHEVLEPIHRWGNMTVVESNVGPFRSVSSRRSEQHIDKQDQLSHTYDNYETRHEKRCGETAKPLPPVCFAIIRPKESSCLHCHRARINFAKNQNTLEPVFLVSDLRFLILVTSMVKWQLAAERVASKS